MAEYINNDIVKLRQREMEFTNLVNSCSRNDLAKCAKFLAMYIALYRQKYGEISTSGYDRLMCADLNKELLDIVDEGIYEAAEMLKIVLLQKDKTDYLDNHNSNLIN